VATGGGARHGGMRAARHQRACCGNAARARAHLNICAITRGARSSLAYARISLAHHALRVTQHNRHRRRALHSRVSAARHLFSVARAARARASGGGGIKRRDQSAIIAWYRNGVAWRGESSIIIIKLIWRSVMAALAA